VLDRAQARRSESRKPGRRWLAGMAAAAALAVGVFSWQSLRVTPPPIEARASSETFYVLKSSLQRLPLPDGSVAELNGATRIEVEYTSAERRVRVIDGEVHFVVAKATDRPFVVVADDVIVRAVGTAFNVRFDTGKIEVLVTEGKVKLMTPAPGAGPSASPVAVAAAGEALVEGQRAVIPRTDVAAATPPVVEIATVNRTEIQEALDWQSTRLVFQDTPLEEAIAGFNRFNRRQLTLGDPALKTRRLSGTFRADNLEGFLRVVRFTVDVKAEPRTALETVLLPIH
jgi:transmembrane sensor